MEHICFPINLHTHWAALAIQSRIRTARKSWSAGSRNGGRLLPAAQNQSKTVPPLSQAKPDGDCKKWASISWYPWFVAFKSTYKKLENPEAAQPFQNRPKPCQKLQYFCFCICIRTGICWCIFIAGFLLVLQVSHVHVLKFVPRTQQACFHNMPLAFATAAVNYYVALNVELGGLFYWWVPDTAFAVQEPYLIMFPPNSPSQYKQDIYKTAKDREAFAYVLHVFIEKMPKQGLKGIWSEL